jgi:hypothetical protein
MQLVEAVYAQTRVNVPTVQGVSTLGNVFAMVINIILGVGWALVFVMLAMGIIQYVMSKGEAKATDAARNWLTAAAIGGIGLFFLTTVRVILFNLAGLGSNNNIGNSQINVF